MAYNPEVREDSWSSAPSPGSCWQGLLNSLLNRMEEINTALGAGACFSPLQERFMLLQQLFQVRLSLPDCARAVAGPFSAL